MNVDRIENCTIYIPSCTQKTLSGPFTFRKKMLWKFGFFFGWNRFNVSRMYAFPFDNFPFMRKKIPNFNQIYRFFDKIQIAQCLLNVKYHTTRYSNSNHNNQPRKYGIEEEKKEYIVVNIKSHL